MKISLLLEGDPLYKEVIVNLPAVPRVGEKIIRQEMVGGRKIPVHREVLKVHWLVEDRRPRLTLAR